MIFGAMKFWNWNQLVLMLSLALLNSQSSHGKSILLHFILVSLPIVLLSILTTELIV